MREQILENKEFNILSRSIDNATKCTVIKVTDDYFTVKLHIKGKFEVDETVELFAMTNKGQLYFETIVKEVNDNIISMWFPINYKYLQRREFTRVQIEKEVILKNNNEQINAKIIDISAGGLKVKTIGQLELLKTYNLNVDIENKQINCTFEPIRIEALDGYFISSGRFKDLNNYDRVSLVQYCFMKQIENSNK